MERVMLQAWVALMLALFATCAYSASKTVLVLGDSLSAGYGLPADTGWVSLLERRLARDHLAVRVVNASISGETSSGGRSRLPQLLEQYRPSVVIIELGANDGLRGLPLGATRENLQAMVGAAKQAKARVLLVGMQIPPNYGHVYTEQFRSLFPAVADRNHVALVPFLLEGIAGDPQLFQADRLHPTAQAQPALLNNIWPQLKTLLTH